MEQPRGPNEVGNPAVQISTASPAAPGVMAAMAVPCRQVWRDGRGEGSAARVYGRDRRAVKEEMDGSLLVGHRHGLDCLSGSQAVVVLSDLGT